MCLLAMKQEFAYCPDLVYKRTFRSKDICMVIYEKKGGVSMRSIWSLGIGFGILIILLILAGDSTKLITYAGYTGGVLWLLAAIISGSLGDGGRIRANYSDADDWRMRMNAAWYLFLAGGVNLGACLLLFTIK